MLDLNLDFYEAIAEKNINRVIDICRKRHNYPDIHAPLNVNEGLNRSIPTENIELIKFMIGLGGSIKYVDENGKRALHHATQTGNIDVVKLILHEGCPVNVPNKEGKTPLHLAVECGSLEIVEILINNGANINRAQTYQMNEYPIHIAAKKGNIRIIDKLRSKGANLENTAAHRRTPLHYAILNRQYCTVEHLCSLHVNINAQDSYEDTPLALALGHGLTGMARILLDHGALVDIPLKNNISVLHYIPSMMSKLSDPGANEDLFQSIMAGATNCINMQSENGTPLHAAVNTKSVRAAELFLDYGANVNAEDQGYTPLQLAVSSNQEAMTKVLLSRRAQLYGRNQSLFGNEHDGNVLHHLLMAQGLSARRSKSGVLKLLLDAGCQVNQLDSRSFTPLDRHLFSTVPYTGHAEVALLVQSGAVLNNEIDYSGSNHGIILRMRQEGRRDRQSSIMLLCTWHGDLITANYLLESSCVTYQVLRSQQWIELPGRDAESESFLSHCREAMKSPESLTRLCRIAIRHYLRILTDDRDIRPLVRQLPLPSMIHKFVNLYAETEEYLGQDNSQFLFE